MPSIAIGAWHDHYDKRANTRSCYQCQKQISVKKNGTTFETVIYYRVGAPHHQDRNAPIIQPRKHLIQVLRLNLKQMKNA